MRAAKYAFVTLVVALMGIGLGSNVLAFHSGGVAECVGCHSMHSANQQGSFLLIGKDQSSTCLTCHEQAGLASLERLHCRLLLRRFHAAVDEADTDSSQRVRQFGECRLGGLRLKNIGFLDQRADPVRLAALGARTANAFDDLGAARVGQRDRCDRGAPRW